MITRKAKPIVTRCIAGLALALTPTCAPLHLPYKSSGPAASREGVEIAVNRQSCTQNVDPEFYGEDLVEEVLEVQVRNSTANPVTVQRDAFQLISPDGHELRTVVWRAGDPVALEAGETRSLELRYVSRGLLACTLPMKLDADVGVKVNGRPVRIEAVTFQPVRAL